jgi:hypothetical protein
MSEIEYYNAGKWVTLYRCWDVISYTNNKVNCSQPVVSMLIIIERRGWMQGEQNKTEGNGKKKGVKRKQMSPLLLHGEHGRFFKSSFLPNPYYSLN